VFMCIDLTTILIILTVKGNILVLSLAFNNSCI
jgi:hypothetical protein